MEIQLFELFKIISWAGVAGMFVYYVLRPIFERIFGKGLYKRLDLLENNHLHEFERRISKLENQVEQTFTEISDLKKEVGYLRGKVNNFDK
jgi:cell division protein FtsB